MDGGAEHEDVSEVVVSESIRKSMRGNRPRDTGPEIAIRRELHRRGLRFRVDYRLQPPLRTRADVVFTRAHVAVFIDGCFWHGCPLHATTPKTNTGYWKPKLERNRVRDLETTAALRSHGWTVLRFWEHEATASVADRVVAAVRPDPPGGPPPASTPGPGF